jgi:8-oxo-dGTP diphosphatase
MFLLSMAQSCSWADVLILDGWMDGNLCPPGGHIEVGETPRIAAVREMKEELGVDLKLDDLEFIAAVARNTSEGETVAYEFAVRNKGYTFMNAEPEKCSELVWVNPEALPDDTVDEFKEIIAQCVLGKQSYLEMGY